MFHIRPEHLEGLAEQQVEGFVERMVAHLREVFPDQVEPFVDGELALIVRKGCELAASWRIDEEPHVERLLELVVSFPQLRRKPLPQWISDIVDNPERPGLQVLCMIEDRILFEERV